MREGLRFKKRCSRLSRLADVARWRRRWWSWQSRFDRLVSIDETWIKTDMARFGDGFKGHRLRGFAS